MTKVYSQSVFNTIQNTNNTKTQKLQQICIRTVKKQTNNKTRNLYIAFSCTFDVSPFRKFVLTHLPNAWFLLYLWVSCTRLLLILISTKTRMIILRPYSGDFTHNSLLYKNVLLYASYTCGEVFTKDFWLLPPMKPMFTSCKEIFSSLRYSFVSSNTLALKSLMSSYSWKSCTTCFTKVRLSFGSL